MKHRPSSVSTWLAVLGAALLLGSACAPGEAASLDPGSGSTPNGNADKDQDGYPAQDDCNDNDPSISPGRPEVPGNGKDDNCDGRVDEAPGSPSQPTQPSQPAAPACDKGETLDSRTAADYAKALGLCNVVEATFLPGSSEQGRAIAPNLAQATGALTSARQGKNLVILSTGRAVYQANNESTCVQPGLELHGRGTDPDPQAHDRGANDMQSLRLVIKVPDNAHGFSFDFHFLTSEYPEYLDSQYNDTFWVHLTSKKHTGNISFDKNGTPIRLNNAFFGVCDADPSRPKTQSMCTTPASALAGSGYYNECKGYGAPGGYGPPGGYGYPGNYGPPGGGHPTNGGGTGWLTTRAGVEPGETITLTFYIFDKGDHALDSTVLIDNFRWDLKKGVDPKPLTRPL